MGWGFLWGLYDSCAVVGVWLQWRIRCSEQHLDRGRAAAALQGGDGNVFAGLVMCSSSHTLLVMCSSSHTQQQPHASNHGNSSASPLYGGVNMFAPFLLAPCSLALNACSTCAAGGDSPMVMHVCAAGTLTQPPASGVGRGRRRLARSRAGATR
jgi:hypothetical protein